MLNVTTVIQHRLREDGYQENEINHRHDSPNNNGPRTFCNHIARSSIVIKSDKFTGDEDLGQYKTYFEDYAELGQWNDRGMFITLVPILKEQSRVLYTSLISVEKKSTAYIFA